MAGSSFLQISGRTRVRCQRRMLAWQCCVTVYGCDSTAVKQGIVIVDGSMRCGRKESDVYASPCSLLRVVGVRRTEPPKSSEAVPRSRARTYSSTISHTLTLRSKHRTMSAIAFSRVARASLLRQPSVCLRPARVTAIKPARCLSQSTTMNMPAAGQRLKCTNMYGSYWF